VRSHRPAKPQGTVWLGREMSNIYVPLARWDGVQNCDKQSNKHRYLAQRRSVRLQRKGQRTVPRSTDCVVAAQDRHRQRCWVHAERRHGFEFEPGNFRDALDPSTRSCSTFLQTRMPPTMAECRSFVVACHGLGYGSAR
jgi:hypothetical protein